LKKRKAVLALSTVGLVLVLLCIPIIPVETKILEGKACPPPPVRRVLKLGLFNFSFYMQNFTLGLTVDGESYTFASDSAHITVRMWHTSENKTITRVFVSLSSCHGEGESFQFYVGELFMEFQAELSGDFEVCDVYVYAKCWVPIVVIIYNMVVNIA